MMFTTIGSGEMTPPENRVDSSCNQKNLPLSEISLYRAGGSVKHLKLSTGQDPRSRFLGRITICRVR